MNHVRRVAGLASLGFVLALVGCGGAYAEPSYTPANAESSGRGGGYSAPSDDSSDDNTQAINGEIARQQRLIEQQSQANANQYQKLTQPPAPMNGGGARQSTCGNVPPPCAFSAR